MRVLHPREAEVFAGLADVYCAPGGEMPPVGDTDAVEFMDGLAADSRRLNRIAFRLTLRVIDVAPLLRGYGARFTRLTPDRRTDFVHSLDRSRWQLLSVGSRLLKTLAVMSYYGDATILRGAGYDPDGVIARGRALREGTGG